MTPAFLFLSLFVLGGAIWLTWLRPPVHAWLEKHGEGFPYDQIRAVLWANDALYERYFGASRLTFVGRGTAAIGWIVSFYDFAFPIVNDMLGLGLDLGKIIPNGELIGPAFMILGHFVTYLRNKPKEE